MFYLNHIYFISTSIYKQVFKFQWWRGGSWGNPVPITNKFVLIIVSKFSKRQIQPFWAFHGEAVTRYVGLRNIRVESCFHKSFCYFRSEPAMRHSNKSEIMEVVLQFPLIVNFWAFRPFLIRDKNRISPSIHTITKTILISFLLAPDWQPSISNKNGFNCCWLSWSTKMKTILKISWPTQVFRIDSSYSTKVLVLQHRFVDDDAVHKRILRLNSCLAVSWFALLFLPLSLYVYALQLHGLSWDASLRIMENNVIWGAIVTVLCRDCSAVDSWQWSRDDWKTENAFLFKTKILCWQDHTFSIWIMWFAEFLCFTVRTVETKMTDKSECQNCFC